ncbi:MAG: PAS domain S-box protein [Desulfobacula sp.]|jgi:two-component system cell cycle sensor histidine kinase/response regulator CckA|nr:PAS domain S-box protein [Desulfobacula sp.]
MKYKYLFGIFFIWIFICGFFFQVIFSDAKEKAINELNSRQLILAIQAQHGIETFFNTTTEFLKKVSESDHIIQLDDRGKQELDLAYKIDPGGAILAITRVDVDGVISYTTPDNPELIGRDISSQKHIQEIFKTKRPTASGVFTAVQGYRAIALHVPVIKNNKFYGTLGVLIDFLSISKDYLENIKLGQTGYAWMTSKEGIELFCPIPGHIGKSVFENCKEFPTIISMANEMVKGEQGKTVYLFDMIRDERLKTIKKYAVYQPIKILDSFWTIVVASSEDELFAGLITFRNKLIILFAFILLGSFYFSYYGMKSWGILREEANRKLAEKALQESEYKLSIHLQNTSIGAISWDMDFKIDEWNPAAETIFGYTKEEVMGKHSAGLILPEDMRGFVDGIFQDLLSGKRGSNSINENITKDGRRIICDWYNTALKDADGKVIGITALVNDITERMQTEEALRESEEKYRTILESIEDGYYEVDMKGNFTFLNDSMCKILGYSKDELTGLNNRRYMDEENAKEVFKTFNRVYKTGQPYKAIDWELIRKDGSRCYVETSVALKRNSNGQPIGFQGIARDISERKKVEKEKILLENRLRQSQKMESIGTLAGGIAHDFNNVLFPIVGYTEMLLEDVPEDSPFKDSLNNIYTSALRAKSLVKQILTFSRQDSNELMLMKVQPIIKEALKLIRSTIPTTIDIKQDINPDCGVIKADPTQIHQIVMNLATNAYHAMEDTGGELKVSLKEIEFGILDLINPDMALGVYA